MSMIRKIIPVSLYDIPGLEGWLEEQASQGLFPTSLGSWAVFEDRGLPGTRFRLDPFANRTGEGLDRLLTLIDKRLDKGKMVAAFLMGSKKLYDFVDDNPDVMMRTVDYVNNPAVICQNPKVVSINSCLQVDFNGQVNSESMGTKQFSGIGGQLDYVRGAAMCPDGKAILAMPSTAKHGEVSRIVPVFEPGTTVTTTRTDVHYIVTEYGVANLRAKSLRERARLLINIAHPKFRDQLWEAYYERYGKEDQ